MSRCLIALCLICLLCAFTGCRNSRDSQRFNLLPEQEPAPTEISVAMFWYAFRQNTPAANAQFLGRRVKMSGIVSGVGRERAQDGAGWVDVLPTLPTECVLAKQHLDDAFAQHQVRAEELSAAARDGSVNLSEAMAAEKLAVDAWMQARTDYQKTQEAPEGHAYMLATASGGFVRCRVQSRFHAGLPLLVKGQPITIIGIAAGVSDNVIVRECELR